MALVALDDVTQLAHGLDHPEGICLTPQGRVYVGGEQGQLYDITDGEARELMRTGGFALGLAADADGNVYMCDQAQQTVWRIDPSTGTQEPFARGPEDSPMRCPNWGAFASDGTYFVSDSGSWHGDDGAIWRRTPDGAFAVWDRQCTGFPNGLCLSEDEQTLYVLESTTPALVAVPINPDGSAGRREVVAQMPGTVPDGVAITTDGRFVVACYRPDVVYLVDRDGQLTELASDPEGTVLAAPTNAIFCGPELDEIMVPNIGRWHVSRFRAPGVRGVPLACPRVPVG